MRSIVIVASRDGNTRLVAEAIANGLRSVGRAEVLRAERGAAAAVTDEVDLVVIGGPTEEHGMTEAVSDVLDVLASRCAPRFAAAFDTRLRWPRFLSGSAADRIAERLEAMGARMVASPESFMLSMKHELLPGELDRALAWGAGLDLASAPRYGDGRPPPPAEEGRAMTRPAHLGTLLG